MKNRIIKITAGIATTASLLYWTTLPVNAADATGGSGGGTGLCPTGNFSVLCNNTPDANQLVGLILNVLLFVSFVAALVFLIYGGIRWIISGGDKEATGKAKGTVTSALIGLVIVLAAWILINIVLKFFNLEAIGSFTLPTINSL